MESNKFRLYHDDNIFEIMGKINSILLNFDLKICESEGGDGYEDFVIEEMVDDE